MIDHYKVLKVSPDATQETIRAQYLFLLQAFHPDKFAGVGRERHLAQAEAETKKLNLAYEVLSHPVRRREFDRQREGETARSQSASGATPRQPPPPPTHASTMRASPPPAPPRPPHRWNVRRTVLLAIAAIISSVLVNGHWLVGRHQQDTPSKAAEGHSETDLVAKLVGMTPAQAYTYGYGQIQPQYDQTMAAVQDDLYPGSVTNQMRRRGGKSELTPANVAEEMRKIYVEAARDPEVLAELRGEAAQAGVSEQVLDSYLQGRLAGTAALDRTDRQPPQAAESEQTRRLALIASPSETIPSQQLAPDNQSLLETAISMCDVYGANEAHRAGLPSIKRDENGEWHITVPVKNIRDDQRQADSLGLMALLLAHTFSGQVNGAVVKCTMTGQTVSGLSEDLVTANSSDFQPKSKAWLVHEDAFPAANQHGWAACHLACDPTMVSKEVVPLSPETPLLRIFPVKQTSAGAFSMDDQTPLLTVYTLASIRWTGNKPTITLNDRDMIAYATITRKYSHDFLYFATNADTGQVARIEGEVTDGEITFTKPEDEAIAAYLRTRFPAGEESQNSVDNDQGFRLYVNRAQRYSVMVSALLVPALRENASGDSVTASSDDGRIKLLLRVKQGVGTAETLYKQWTAEHTTRDPGKVVDYKTFHGNWFVVSGHNGPRGYYVKVVVRGSESLFLCLEYDEEQSSNLGAMLTKMSRSFTGDVDSSSGTVVQATPPAAPKPTQTRAADANAQPVPAAGSLSRQEWRERLRKYCTIPSGHQLLSNEKRLFAVMGKPDDVEHEGRNTYWYYKCSDGIVQLAFQFDPEMMGGQIIAEVSDEAASQGSSISSNAAPPATSGQTSVAESNTSNPTSQGGAPVGQTQPSGTDSDKEHLLVGSWKIGGRDTVVSTYTKNHEYFTTCPGENTETGTWRIEGDTLIQSPKSGSLVRLDSGHGIMCTILELNQNVLIIGSPGGNRSDAMTAVRIR